MAGKNSEFKLFGIGVCAINKERTTDIIEVLPIEDLNLINGEITDHYDIVETKGKDGLDEDYESKVIFAPTIRAKWLAGEDSNRKTSPDVRRGEKVRIYRLADSDSYYWKTFHNHGKTRRLETVLHAYSGLKEEDEELNEENSYTTMVSTHDRYVRLIKTSKRNKEKFIYEIYVDTENSAVMIQDDVGNFFTLMSPENNWRMENANGCFFDMKQDKIHMHAVEEIKVTAGERIIEITPNLYTKSEHEHIGSIHTSVDVIADDVSLTRHRHIGDSGGITAPPIGGDDHPAHTSFPV